VLRDGVPRWSRVAGRCAAAGLLVLGVPVIAGSRAGGRLPVEARLDHFFATFGKFGWVSRRRADPVDLRAAHPRAHVSLHAGELTASVAEPGALPSHVRDAVTVAGAERIGHGVDIAGEDDAGGTLRTMAGRHVLVETALTSNCQTLREPASVSALPAVPGAGGPGDR
jgi:hypothetical protein